MLLDSTVNVDDLWELYMKVGLLPCAVFVRFFPLSSLCTSRVPTAQGKHGKWPKTIPVRENTGNLEIVSKHRKNTGNFVQTQGKNR